MAKCATVAPAQTEAAVLAIGTAETACEGRLYPTSDTNKVYIGMADGTLVGPLPGSSGGGASLDQTETLEVPNEIRIVITFNGTVPVLSKVSDGVFEISIPGNTRVKGYHATSLPSITYSGSNTLRLRISDAGGKSLYGIYSVHQQSTGEEAEEFAGVIERQTLPATGTVQSEFPNMSNLAGGFVVIGVISI